MSSKELNNDTDSQENSNRGRAASGISQLGLGASTADLELIGSEIIDEPLVQDAKSAQESSIVVSRAGVKQALLNRGLPGVSL